ncbi:MAG: hypothetical protein ACYCYF_02690 [Anaerolineae bacterium]
MPTQWFEIRVEGELPGDWSYWFEGLEVRCGPPGECALWGPLADQAALHGVLAKIRDLNLTLIAVCRLPEGSLPDGRPQGQGAQEQG